MKMISIIKSVALIIVSAIAVYMVIPKYEIYVSAGDGSITYRFNKITGDIQSTTNGKWESTEPMIIGIARPGTFKNQREEFGD